MHTARAPLPFPHEVPAPLPIGPGTELVRAAASTATRGDIGPSLAAVTAYLVAALAGAALVGRRAEAA